MFGYVTGEMQFYIQLIMFNLQPFNSDLSIHEGVLVSKCNECIIQPSIVLNCQPDCVVHQSDHVSRYFVVCETVAEKITYFINVVYL